MVIGPLPDYFKTRADCHRRDKYGIIYFGPIAIGPYNYQYQKYNYRLHRISAFFTASEL
jgi:hypothetical protein